MQRAPSCSSSSRPWWPVALALLALVAGCATAPPPAPALRELPAAWSMPADPAAAAVDLHWWARLGDPLLADLVEQALAANTDIRTAQARLRSAEASAGLAGAARQPSVSAAATAQRAGSRGQSGSNTLGASLGVSWDPDLSGALRLSEQAARADADSAAAALASVRVSVAAAVAGAYVDLRTLQQRAAHARANLASQQETAQIVAWRERAGLASRLEVELARLAAEQARAQVPALEGSLAAARHALALLLGQAPAALDERLAAPPGGENLIDTLRPAAVATGIPADLLRRRADLVAAEHTLRAAVARTGEADAARRPSLSLSGSVGLQAATIGALTGGEAFAHSLLAQLAAPVFDAGRLRRQLEIREAAQEQALVAYEAAVLGALREVEDALASLAAARQRVEALVATEAAAREAAELARQRQRSGIADLLAVLEAERSQRSAQDALASGRGDAVAALVQLYKALGGGWSADGANESPR